MMGDYMNDAYRTIGKNILRIGAVERLKGDPVFSADLKLDQPLTLRALRSTRAHARIRGIDLEKALQIKGVIRIFIAEDVPDLVATKDRKGLSPMDIVAVVTKVVQDQQETIKDQGKEIQALKALLQQTLAGLSTLNQKVNHLESVNGQPLLRQSAY